MILCAQFLVLGRFSGTFAILGIRTILSGFSFRAWNTLGTIVAWFASRAGRTGSAVLAGVAVGSFVSRGASWASVSGFASGTSGSLRSVLSIGSGGSLVSGLASLASLTGGTGWAV
jgi:hypothetical protein